MPDPSTPKIMLVDDDATIRESVAAFLRANAYEVSSATDGYDALWQLKSGPVDLMIADLEMPGLAGVEFLSVIREQFPKTVVIAMSERSCDEAELAAVADAFYPKVRHDPKKLLGSIAQLLRDSSVWRTGNEIVPSEASSAGRSSARRAPPQVAVTCPECFESCAMAPRQESVLRDASEISCVSCGKKLGYAVACACSTGSPRQGGKIGPPGDSVPIGSWVSAWEFLRRVLRKLRQFGGWARPSGAIWHRAPAVEPRCPCDPADAQRRSGFVFPRRRLS